MARKLLGEILRENGTITAEQLKEALKRQRESHEILGHILYDLGAVSERDLQQAWGVQLGREFVDLRETLLSADLIRRLDGALARRYCAIPLREEDGTVVVAMANPLDVRALAEIAQNIGRPVRSAIASASELEEAIEKYYD
jgi:type IV pilus assembly protein PilB